MDSLSFEVEGQTVVFEIDVQNVDIGKLTLGKPIHPGQTIEIEVGFRVKIPFGTFSRMGCDSTSFQVSQWFPKLAVYDRKGWHPMPYLDQGEFYSDFGDYDVTITLPEKYVVASTGKLVTSSELNFLTKLDSLTSANRSKNSRSLNPNINSTVYKTIRFVQENVHDFAWFADIDFRFKKGQHMLKSGKVIETNIFFRYNPDLVVHQITTTINTTLNFYSEMVGDYPYSSCSVVIGNIEAGAGMEYPTITVISSELYDTDLQSTVAHEIGHNWFYGSLGFNERDFAWMDEGINTFYQILWEQKFLKSKKGSSIFNLPDLGNAFGFGEIKSPTDYFLQLWFSFSRNTDQSPSLKSTDFSLYNYALSVYYKPALSLISLRNFIGHSEFDSLMRVFYSLWEHKHPQPEDFRTFFVEKAGKNLDWFFDGLIGSNYKVDYKISAIKKVDGTGSKTVTLKNCGDVEAPIGISLINKNGNETIMMVEGFSGEKEILIDSSVVQVIIDSKMQSLDNNWNNNNARTNGFFKKFTPIDLGFVYHLPTPNKRFIFVSPVLAWNAYNKSMLGAIFYNDPIIERPFAYQLMPMYSFRNQNINGEASVQFNFYPKKLFRKITLAASVKKYDFQDINFDPSNSLPNSQYFVRLNPELRFYISPLNTGNNNSNILKLRFISLLKQVFVPKFDLNEVYFEEDSETLNLAEISFLHSNKRKINPLSIELKSHLNDEVIKFMGVFNYRFNYNKSKELDIRFFGGYIAKITNSIVNYSFSTSSFDGNDDYLFDNLYVARSNSIGSGFWSAQAYQSEGGFMLPTFIGKGQKWLFALNLKSSIPKTNLLKLYTNFSVYDKHPFLSHSRFLYEGGVSLQIVENYFEIYFPVLWSKDIEDVFELNNLDFYEQKIRFVLRFDLVNPFKYLQDISL